MTFYICITILTVLIMVTMILHISHYSGFAKTQKSWFITTFLAIIVCSIAEFLVHSGYYDPKYAIVLTIITAFQFSLAPILGILFAGALGVKHQEIVGIICYSINLIIEAVSAPFGLIFYFNEEGYVRGEYFIIYEAIYFLSLV